MTDETNSAPQGPAPSLFDIGHLLAIARRRAPVFLAVTVLITALVIFVATRATPIYQATASIAIDPKQRDVTDLQAASNGQADSNGIDTEVQILSSRAIATQVAQRLGMDQAAPAAAAKPNIVNQLLHPHAAAAVVPSGASALDDAASQLMSQVNIRRSGLTYIINITASSTNPARAAEIANAYASVYLLSQVSTRNDQVADSSATLTTKLAELRAAAESADAQVQSYKISHNLLSAQGSTAAESEVTSINQQIATAKADVAEKQAKLDAARAQMERGGGGADINAALGSETIRQLRNQEAQAQSRLANLTQRYGDRYGDVIRAKEELASIQQNIREEITRIISALQADVQVSQQRLDSLSSSQRNANGRLVSDNTAIAGLTQLQSRADAARQTYETYQSRADQSVAQQGSALANARVVSAAQPPTVPSSPKLKLAALFGLAAGMVAGVLTGALLELLSVGIETGADVERRFGVTYAGPVPMFKTTVERDARRTKPENYLVEKPFSAFSESLRALRIFLMRPNRNAVPPKVVAIVSALPREGKSLTSFCLARTMAMAGSKVVLLDCDLRRRGVTALAPATQFGLMEVLSGTVPLEKALVKDDLTDAYFLTVQSPPTTANDPFTTEAMDQLLKTLSEHFDFVLMDTAPVLAVAETRHLAAKADATLMLSRWRHTPAKAVDLALDLVVDSGANLVGVALTQVDLRRQSRHGYGDRYYYYKAYKTYYTG